MFNQNNKDKEREESLCNIVSGTRDLLFSAFFHLNLGAFVNLVLSFSLQTSKISSQTFITPLSYHLSDRKFILLQTSQYKILPKYPPDIALQSTEKEVRYAKCNMKFRVKNEKCPRGDFVS